MDNIIRKALEECRAHFEREISDDHTMIDSDFGDAYRLTCQALSVDVLSDAKTISLADKLRREFNSAWTRQTNAAGDHAYNKEAWQDLESMIIQVASVLEMLRSSSSVFKHFLELEMLADVPAHRIMPRPPSPPPPPPSRQVREGELPDSSLLPPKAPPPDPREKVNHPAHYGGDTTYEVIKVLEAWGLDEDFCLGNTIKYIARMGKKDGHTLLNELKKARWYLDRRIANLEKE